MNKKPLFCFTYAGGTSQFYDFFDGMFDNIEVVKLEYSGHGSRYKEKLNKSFDEVVDDLYPNIREYVEKNNITEYGLMGYSMGSIAVFAMLQYIHRRSEIILPQHIFIAAHEPMTRINLLDIPVDQIDAYVKQRTLEFGAVPNELVENAIFWRMYLPIYKSDYQMIARYDFAAVNYMTDIPLTVFYSEKDTKYEDMLRWKQYFIDSNDFVEYDGNHFFIKKYYKEIAEVIRDRME